MKNRITLLIDLDGTVYDKYNGMWEEMSDRIDAFIHYAAGVPTSEVVATREKYYNTYGSALRGLQLHHEINSEEYLAFVHDLDLSKHLSPDKKLRQILKNIPFQKWIFTNSDRNHTMRVLKALGLDDLFDGIFDVWEMLSIPKPQVRAYQHVMTLLGNPDPRTCVFVDDTLKNLPVPQKMGWHTVWVDNDHQDPGADYTIPSLHQLPEVLEKIETKMMYNQIPVHSFISTPHHTQPTALE